jgi:hypothetical protein
MKVKNHKEFAFTDYNQYPQKEHIFELGEVVINKYNEVGVIIQLHEDLDYRTDMFGNCSESEIRLATLDEIKNYRFDILIMLMNEEIK